ncbi:MAG: enoyl-CoA hydratase [Reyranella sp.]|nr:enoyl-CoA hydratase [Reyranella sp.]
MFQTILYETPAPNVARIVLNRPDSRNAQDTRLLYELNDAFDLAARDDAVSVIILAANGPHFSSGHDLREPDPTGSLAEFKTVGTWCGFGCAGAEGWMAREKELYQGLCERWRNIAKPTIAEVQGKCIAGGLMLIWPCDLIIAGEDATFADNTVSMGMTGVEYFGHPWELGPRKAKELLFTSDWLPASEAHRLGMVNHVVPNATLSAFTLDLARRIAQKPLFALKLAKEAVNAAEDAQGRMSAMQTAFAIHQLSHSHNMQVHGLPIDPRGAGGLVPAKS